MTCSDKGLLEMYSFELNALFAKEEAQLEEEEEEQEETPKQKDIISITPKVTSFNVGGGNVSTMEVVRLGGNKMEVAVAGKDNLMKIYDVETQKCVYRAKNVPNDYLNLKSPIWDNGIVYLGQPEQNNGNLICTRTAHHQVRFYDRRVKRAPITQKSIGDYTFTSMIASPKREREVVVGTAIGKMYRYNFEKLDSKTLRSYKTMSGSVRDIQAHPNGDLLATASTDRYVRVYDFESSRVLHSMYLVQRQNCILVSKEELSRDNYEQEDDDDKKEDEKAEESDNEDDIDDPKNGVWKNMKKVLHDDGEEDISENDDSEEDINDGFSDDDSDDSNDDQPTLKRKPLTRGNSENKRRAPPKKTAQKFKPNKRRKN
jgi:WD40 repeat protein